MKNTFYLIFVSLLIIIVTKLVAQNNSEPINVNPSIGDTLLLSERNYYKLLPTIEEFQFAVFYLNLDSTLNAEVHYFQNGVSRDTLIQNYRSLRSLNFHINARNAVENNLPLKDYKSFGQTEGEIISVFKTNNSEVSGELLFVRKNSLLLLKQECNNYEYDQGCIDNINRAAIDKVFIKGNSNLSWGIGLGVLASVIAGVFIFQSYDDGSLFWGYDAIAPIILSSVGCISLGVAIGIYTSTPDEIINPTDQYEYLILNKYSRYKFSEPDELKSIEWGEKWKNI